MTVTRPAPPPPQPRADEGKAEPKEQQQVNSGRLDTDGLAKALAARLIPKEPTMDYDTIAREVGSRLSFRTNIITDQGEQPGRVTVGDGLLELDFRTEGRSD